MPSAMSTPLRRSPSHVAMLSPVVGVPIAKNAALLEIGLNVAINSHAALGSSCTSQLSQDAQDHALKANLAVNF